MPAAALDACCLIDVVASGHASAILTAAGIEWHLPAAVQSEVKFVRQVDPGDPTKTINSPIDLSPLIQQGVLKLCQPQTQSELTAFTQYAVQFRSDGEAMCLALAACRGWSVATDDRKAIRIAGQAGLTVVSSPELLKSWADAAKPDKATLQTALKNIERFAQFQPSPSMPEHSWWVATVNAP